MASTLPHGCFRSVYSSLPPFFSELVCSLCRSLPVGLSTIIAKLKVAAFSQTFVVFPRTVSLSSSSLLKSRRRACSRSVPQRRSFPTWLSKPPGTSLSCNLLQSEAFSSLSPCSEELWLLVLPCSSSNGLVSTLSSTVSFQILTIT